MSPEGTIVPGELSNIKRDSEAIFPFLLFVLKIENGAFHINSRKLRAVMLFCPFYFTYFSWELEFAPVSFLVAV